MKKNLPLIGLGVVVLVAGLLYAAWSWQNPPEGEQTQEEAAQEVEQTQTPEDAGELTIEKTDQDFSTTTEAEFNADGLSDEMLGL